MNSLSFLKATLLDLDRALEEREVPLTIGGGFGLYLKQERIRKAGVRTLFEQLPEPRATNDIDVFIRTEVLVELETVRRLQFHIERLGFVPVSGAEFFQWIKTFEDGRVAKLDVLCGPLGKYRKRLYTNSLPRVRPKARKGTLRFHARYTEEAIEIEEQAEAIQIEGLCSDGTPHTATVYIPHPFTYMVMKLFAFDDRKNDDEKEVGRHHAMDLYGTVAMMTEPEYEQSVELGLRYRADVRAQRAARIVAVCFGEPSALGLLRLREHRLFRNDFPIGEFSDVLNEVFRVGDASQ